MCRKKGDVTPLLPPAASQAAHGRAAGPGIWAPITSGVSGTGEDPSLPAAGEGVHSRMSSRGEMGGGGVMEERVCYKACEFTFPELSLHVRARSVGMVWAFGVDAVVSAFYKKVALAICSSLLVCF